MNGSAERRRRRPTILSTIVLVVLWAGAASVRPAVRSTVDQPRGPDISELWEEPADLHGRDLFHGPGGPVLTPDPTVPFVFVTEDGSGDHAGYEVRSLDGTRWSVRLGPEAQSEVVVSRVLWAIGYHQPATYYLPAWTLSGDRSGPQPAGRFRPELEGETVVGEWSWYENAFVGTQPFKGLLVANLLLNNWDWKTSNNKIYEIAGDAGERRRAYVVRDVGASLGGTSFPRLLDWYPFNRRQRGSHNHVEDFESQAFIRRVDGERVEFEYRGGHGALLDSIAPADVAWACRLMSRLSDQQWHDAFRAAGYGEDQMRRFVARIKSKLDEGLTLHQG